MMRIYTNMYKMEHYLGVDFSTKESTKKSTERVKEVLKQLGEELLEWVTEWKNYKEPIIGKITIEYATKENWKTINKIREENEKIQTLIKIQSEWEEELKKNPNTKYIDIMKRYVK